MTRKHLVVSVALLLAVSAPAPAQVAVTGRPSQSALASARSKADSMRRPNGPRSVTLSADEMASLVEAELHPNGRRALDSVRVSLAPGRLTLQGYLITSVWGGVLLGPLSMMLDPLEPMTVSGPARATAPGVIAWHPDSFSVRTFSFPQSAIPAMVNRLTGSSDGAIPIAVPPTVSRVWIGADRVTFSRR